MTSTESLCSQGELFPDRFSIELEGITYTHPEGERTVRIDEAILRQGRAYTDDPLLLDSLVESSIPVARHSELLSFLHTKYLEDTPIVGVSGYATPGYPYHKEMEALDSFYDRLRKMYQLPGLTVDGGVSSGVLGINGLQSQIYGVPSLGIIPKQGLHRIGQRDHMAIQGETYRDREVIVGTVPDILVCVGGADGTRRECQEALSHGSAVLLLALGDEHPAKSLAASYDQYEDIENALRDGTMRVSRTLANFLVDVDETVEYTRQNYDDRLFRFEALRRYFGQVEGQPS